MATKLSSPRAELAALRAACHADPVISGTILSGVDESHFHADESKEILSVILQRRNEDGRAPRYKMLLEDPHLSKDTLSYLRSSEALIHDRSEAARCLTVLNEFRRRRGLFNMGAYLSEQMNGSKIRTDVILDNISAATARLRATNNKNQFVHLGRNDNASKLVHNILYGDRNKKIIPTGFKTFDDVNGGFFRGSLVTIGGTTSGGKSMLASQLLVNMVSMGYKCHIVPLEMEEEEMVIRIMACVTGFDALDIQLGRLTMNEKKLVEKRFLAWRKKVHAKGGRYTIFKPQEDMTVEDIMASLHAYQSDVVLIDYLGLAKDMDGDDQWRKMGSAARYCKINAGTTNRVIILLVQINDDGVIRYSKAVQEHANNSFMFVTNAETRELGIINIKQGKARNQKMFDFTLKTEANKMRVFDMPNEGVGDGDEPSRAAPTRKEAGVPNLAAGEG